MAKTRVILAASAVFLILMMPAMTPINALEISSPVPISRDIIPTGGLGVSIPLTLPDLGTVSLNPVSIYSISKTQSGLIASDSLTNETRSQQDLAANNGYWFYGGDAPFENAPYAFWRDMQGLHVGVQAPSNGTWAGYYAVSPPSAATVFHSVVTTPVQTIPSNNNWYGNGMYVQNGDSNVSYITCDSNTSIYGTQWLVASTVGNNYQTLSEKILYASPVSMDGPRTADCTIITNGSNFLEVILNNAIVFKRDNMTLNYENPMVDFLEPQSSYAGELLNGTFTNFFEASSTQVKVTDNPSLSSTVDLVVPTQSGSGRVVASAPVDASGNATFDMANLPMPLNAYIKVYNSLGVEIASTSGPVTIYGGDSYSVNSLGSGLLGGLGL